MTSPQSEKKYATLMETSGQECESWYYFIEYSSNKENLEHLQKQLESVNWYIVDDLSTFDLDLTHLVSEKTAKEVTKLELNHTSFHRKFDGELKQINLGFKPNEKNKRKMIKAFDKLGYGQIEDYVDKEDIDQEDLTDNEYISSSDEGDYSSSLSDEYISDSDEDNNKTSDTSDIPPALLKA